MKLKCFLCKKWLKIKSEKLELHSFTLNGLVWEEAPEQLWQLPSARFTSIQSQFCARLQLTMFPIIGNQNPGQERPAGPTSGCPPQGGHPCLLRWRVHGPNGRKELATCCIICEQAFMPHLCFMSALFKIWVNVFQVQNTFLNTLFFCSTYTFKNIYSFVMQEMWNIASKVHL